MTATRIETTRTIAAAAADVFALLCDPQGHVAIDATGMLQDADGEPVTAAGDSFVVHMDRESLDDIPDYGTLRRAGDHRGLRAGRLISWSIIGRVRPPIGHVYGYRLEPVDDGTTLVTSFYDWSDARPDWVATGMLPGGLRDRPQGHARHPGPHRAPRLPRP